MELPEVACPSCGASYRHPGKSGSAKCKKCGAVVKFSLPGEASGGASAGPAKTAVATARPTAPPSSPAARPSAPSARPAAPAARAAAAPARAAGPVRPAAGGKPAAAPPRGAGRPAGRGGSRSAESGEAGEFAPIKKQGLSPAVLWGSIGGTVVVIVILFVVIGQQNAEKERRIAAEKEAAALAAKGESAPKPKPVPVDDGPTLSSKTAAPADDGPSLSKPDGKTATAGGGDKPADKPTDKPADPSAGTDPSPTGPKKRFTPKELSVVANVPNVSEAEITKINGLLTTWLDPNETIGANKAMRELEQIGKPAIPLVLNRLREIDMADDAKIRDATALNRALQNITGKMYEMSREISEQGVTERLMIRQSWFSWWEKNKNTFTGKAAPTDE